MEPIVSTDKDNEFRRELSSLLNRFCRENCSDTPDFLLAEYLSDCLNAFDTAVRERERWYGRYVMGKPGARGEGPFLRTIGDPETGAAPLPATHTV